MSKCERRKSGQTNLHIFILQWMVLAVLLVFLLSKTDGAIYLRKALCVPSKFSYRLSSLYLHLSIYPLILNWWSCLRSTTLLIYSSPSKTANGVWLSNNDRNISRNIWTYRVQHLWNFCTSDLSVLFWDELAPIIAKICHIYTTGACRGIVNMVFRALMRLLPKMS